MMMTDEKLDDALEGALAAVVESYGGGNQLVPVENADRLVYDELERRGYLSFLDYDLSGGAIMTPSYKAVSHYREIDMPISAPSHKPKNFETFGETYTNAKVIGNGGAGNVYEVIASNGEHYALKLLIPEAARNSSKLKRFLQEARYEMDGKCSAIVRAVDRGSIGTGAEKRPFYVMPLISGSLEVSA